MCTQTHIQHTTPPHTYITPHAHHTHTHYITPPYIHITHPTRWMSELKTDFVDLATVPEEFNGSNLVSHLL